MVVINNNSPLFHMKAQLCGDNRKQLIFKSNISLFRFLIKHYLNPNRLCHNKAHYYEHNCVIMLLLLHHKGHYQLAIMST